MKAGMGTMRTEQTLQRIGGVAYIVKKTFISDFDMGVRGLEEGLRLNIATAEDFRRGRIPDNGPVVYYDAAYRGYRIAEWQPLIIPQDAHGMDFDSGMEAGYTASKEPQ